MSAHKKIENLLQRLEALPLPLNNERCKELCDVLRVLASDKSPKADTLCERALGLVEKDDTARIKKLIARRDALVRKRRRGKPLTAEEEKLVRTVSCLRPDGR